MLHRVDAELARVHGFADARGKHQMIHVVTGDDDPLLAREPAAGADAEKALDLAGHAAHGHDLAGLAHRAGDGEGQFERHAGKRRQQRRQLRARGGIAFDAAVILLETQASGHHKRLVAGELVHKIALEDKHGLGVDGAAKLGLALKVDDAAVPDAHCAGNLMR